jgi:hypothetical protein
MDTKMLKKMKVHWKIKYIKKQRNATYHSLRHTGIIKWVFSLFILVLINITDS